jgi:cell division septation protein DedD
MRLESQEVSHPVVAKRSRLTANSSSMKETTGLQTTKPARSSARNAASATGPTSVSASTSILPFVEPYYPITTESGKPAIVQAADKRLAAMENAEKAKELHAKLKIRGTKGPVGDLTRSERRSRNESLLPFGVSAPEMLAWHMEVRNRTFNHEK